MSAVKDFLGRAINANDTVVYPVREGSNMDMKKMKVTLVEADRLVGYNPAGRKINITNLKNVVVVEDVLPEAVAKSA
jgi:hypothetical protein